MRVNAINPNLTHSSIKAKSNNKRVVDPVVSAPITFKGKTGKGVYTSLGAICGGVIGAAFLGPIGAVLGALACGKAAHTEADVHENASPEEHDGWVDYAEDHARWDRD